MRFRLILIVAVATIAALLFGGDMLLKGIKFRQPQTMTYTQFLAAKPTEGWFRITNGVLNVADETHVLEKGHENNLDELKDVYVPLLSADGGPVNDTTHVLVLTGDPAIIAAVQELGVKSASLDTKEKAEAFITKNRDRFLVTRDVEGTLKSGLGAEDSDNVSQLKKLNSDTLAPDFVVLEEGVKPSMLKGIGLFSLGVVMAFGQLIFYTRGIRQRG